VSVSCPQELKLQGDLALLASAFTNLLDNALRHGGPNTSMAIHAEATNGSLQLDFIDDGVGIPPDVRSTVFQRFRRGRPRDASGTGLGLAIVESVMKAHRGSVSLVAAAQGTTVRLILPLITPR
jgi:signal transduction histidine kinase